ncbi:tRNA-binding protein [Thalassotalea litorea]|uniref:tRNA-binding protein n=1 Tax=Thalassotalea litorea TaxID=2020715 RepID=UPI003736C98A
MEQIQWQDFSKVQLCVGTVIAAEAFPQAHKPAYKLTLDFGEHGTKKSSAQITELYTIEELIGKQVVAVINFPDKQIGPFMSECLVTGFYNQHGQVCLAVPDGSVPNGARLA